MALGRSRRNVLIIDSAMPCNRQTPHAHNLLTHDGKRPADIRNESLAEVLAYPTVRLQEGFVEQVTGTAGDFSVRAAAGDSFAAKRILLATGVRDIPLPIDGFEACWGISVLHCPYCHGYEVRDLPLGVIGNGDLGFEYARMVRHWTPSLTVLTNGPATFTPEQRTKLESHGVRIEERSIRAFNHNDGQLQAIRFEDGSESPFPAVFARAPISQHSSLAADLGCSFQTEGMFPDLIQADAFGRTSVPGISAAGDNCSPFRSLASAIGAGATAGAFLNNELIAASF
jgi:thioredoxin reductase